MLHAICALSTLRALSILHALCAPPALCTLRPAPSSLPPPPSPQVHVVDDQPTMRFVSVGYKIDSIESERIAVDHVAHILPSGAVC